MMLSLLSEIAAKYKLRRKNDRWSGACPQCGGSATSDKFVIRTDGGFKCYSCDFKGDIITWLREMDGMTCPEAYEAVGIACTNTQCAVYGTCRMGDKSGPITAPRSRPLVPQTQTPAPPLPTTQVTDPKALWQNWATALVEKSTAALKEQPQVIGWLNQRGIDQVAIARFNLGWLDHDRQVPRQQIGLTREQNEKPKLWVPGGLVIPTVMDGTPALHRLRIRRPQESLDRFLPDLKYVWIKGSGTSPMVIRPDCTPRGCVVVEAELDGIAVASAHPEVMVIALGTVSAGLPVHLKYELLRVPVILVALDAELEKKGKPGAGPKAIKAWATKYRHAKFWPVTAGKDPGEFAEQGGDLLQWVEAGLPPQFAHDLGLLPGCSLPGERGEQKNEEAAAVAKDREGVAIDAAAPCYILTMHDGREIYIVSDREQWDQLAEDGHLVFSKNELLRMQQLCIGADAADCNLITSTILDLKEVFVNHSAYVHGSRVDCEPQEQEAEKSCSTAADNINAPGCCG